MYQNPIVRFRTWLKIVRKFQNLYTHLKNNDLNISLKYQTIILRRCTTFKITLHNIALCYKHLKTIG